MWIDLTGSDGTGQVINLEMFERIELVPYTPEGNNDATWFRIQAVKNNEPIPIREFDKKQRAALSMQYILDMMNRDVPMLTQQQIKEAVLVMEQQANSPRASRYQ